MPPKSSTLRRNVSRNVSNTAVDDLATKFTNGLQISDAQSKSRQKQAERPSSQDPTQRKLSAMRTVNTASQKLSAISQSGRSSTGAEESAATAARALRDLRELSPGDVDVERAAASVVGKLITLDMGDAARSIVSEMHPRVHALVHGDQLALEAHYTSIPLPPDPARLDPVVLMLTSTYLLHALTVCSTAGASLELLLSHSSFLSWSRVFRDSLPQKHVDGIFTRAYTVLTKSDSISLRFFALACLVHTSPGTVSAEKLWDQGTKCVATAAKSSDNNSEAILSSISMLIAHAETRSELLQGKSFATFCEYWTALAKRSRRLDVLDRIARFTGAGSSSSGSDLSAAGMCAVFAQATLVLEKDNGPVDEHDKHVRNATTALVQLASEQSNEGLALVTPGDEKAQPSVGKLRRAVERLRRAAMKSLEKASGRDLVRSLLLAIVNALEHCLREQPAADLYTQILDSQFFLARTTLDIRDARTYGTSFDCLARCERLLGSGFRPNNEEISHSGIDKPNYLRCISGAFHNLGGTLYQAERYGAAVRFLTEACTLGVRALAGRASDAALIVSDKGKGRAREDTQNEDAWKQLGEQVFRRWELLGVCFSKMGDRRAAHGAYLEAIRHFPYASTGFLQQLSAPGDIFDASPAVKQLSVIVDRVTYIGTFELLLEPSRICLTSLAAASQSPASPDHAAQTDLPPTNPMVLAALLERQLASLDNSRWKEGASAALRCLLDSLLGLYKEDRVPLRRARILLKCLEFSYYDASGIDSHCAWKDFSCVVEEITKLCGLEDFDEDAGLASMRDYFLTSAHVWAALHVHRTADAQQVSLVQHHAEEACGFLSALLNSVSYTVANANDVLSPKGLNANKTSPKLAKVSNPRGGRNGARKPPSPKAPRKAPARRVATKKVEHRTKSGPLVSSRAKIIDEVHAEPVTPKPSSTQGPQEGLAVLAVKTRPSLPQASLPITGTDFDNLNGLIKTLSSILTFLGLAVLKIRVLHLLRRLCEMGNGPNNDAYILVTVVLANEYTKLGKTRKANSLYRRLSHLREDHLSREAHIKYLLRYAQSMALSGDVLQSSSIYCEAFALCESSLDDEKPASSIQRLQQRAAKLEQAAMAAEAFAAIQYAKGDIATSLDGLLQSLRLWNRAMDSLGRLAPSPPSKTSIEEDNPFEVPQAQAISPRSQAEASRTEQSQPRKCFLRRAMMSSLEWSIAEGLVNNLFKLTRAYFVRGSPREAQYFAEQVHDLAAAINAPAILSQSLARLGELQIYRGQLEDGCLSLAKAGETLDAMQGTEIADVSRLRADCSQREAKFEDAREFYEHARTTLEELEKSFGVLEFSTRKSSVSHIQASPASSKEMLAPELLALVLHKQIWLLREDGGDRFRILLDFFLSLPPSRLTKAEETHLMAKLTMRDVHERFGLEMFLSSITESTISIPMGMSSSKPIALSSSVVEILGGLAKAEELFWSALSYASVVGDVARVREAAISLATTRVLRTSLGKGHKEDSVVAVELLDYSNAIALRREILDTISHKFAQLHSEDDLEWPVINHEGLVQLRQAQSLGRRARLNGSTLDSDDERNERDEALRKYWENLRAKYQSLSLQSYTQSSSSRMTDVPENWVVVHISVTEDKNTLFITRQQGGDQQCEPLVFCVPLRGRRENEGVEDDEHLTFEGAQQELAEIIRLSDEGTRSAVHVSANDMAARENWWKDRKALDTRMKELVENIEFCWLGAFKTILNPSSHLSAELTNELRGDFERVFQFHLGWRDKPKSKGTTRHSKHGSSVSHIKFDDTLLQCFSTLSPKCRDEELEDLIYFILDLYQFHGVAVAPAEVDIAQSVQDLRSVLEDHAQRVAKRAASVQPLPDEHIFLVLDKNVQSIPWESIPTLRGRSVSRIPSLDFLLDRIQLVKLKTGTNEGQPSYSFVDPRRTAYVLNPSGDLLKTEGRFKDWLRDMHAVGWSGISGCAPSEQQFLDALSKNDLVLYFGHGGGEQYARSHKIRHLSKCAAVMLWGCSSGNLRDMGDFDRVGTPYNYILAGCPTLVANLWDVTDRDIDKFSQSVFDKLHLNAKDVKTWRPDSGAQCSLVTAVAQSRTTCKLQYLTGAAPVVYGIPFYL